MRFSQSSCFKAKVNLLRGASSTNRSTIREIKHLREFPEVLSNLLVGPRGPVKAALKCYTKAANDQFISQRRRMQSTEMREC